jgi:endonuclease/exonuclease/phosphatase family metal-dependent hydrolase
MTASAGPRLRILTYNVRSLRDDADAVARVIRSAEPHLACIQEAPRFARWRTKCAALARRSGMVVVTGGRTAAGNLILSSLAVDVVARRDQLLSRDRGLHQRGVALASLRWRGQHLGLASTHLDLEAQSRLRHVGEIERALADFLASTAAAAGAAAGAGPIATVVAADVNDEPASATWAALTANRTDAFAVAGTGDPNTFTASNPRRRLDGVFLGGAVTAVAATVLDGADVTRGSDHRPVLVELELE